MNTSWRRDRRGLWILVLALAPAVARGADPPPPGAQDAQSPPAASRQRTWELPPVRVQGEPAPSLREEERVGPYAQPRWTARRRFPSTRVYVVPEGKVEVEAWARSTLDKRGPTEWRFLQELEIGLPYRFQLDLYLRQDYGTAGDNLRWGGQFEVRWALADWGSIWGNPTLYLEYISLGERPDKIEPKLLLGGEIAERWHWGANLVTELELGGEREYEYAATSGVSYSVVDDVLAVGLESVVSLTHSAGHRSNLATSIVIGPSLQWRPVAPLTINLAPLLGVTGESPRAQIFLNAGWEF